MLVAISSMIKHLSKLHFFLIKMSCAAVSERTRKLKSKGPIPSNCRASVHGNRKLQPRSLNVSLAADEDKCAQVGDSS